MRSIVRPAKAAHLSGFARGGDLEVSLKSTDKSMYDEQRIRERAHDIWQREGRPEGRHDQHWEQARREIEAEDTNTSG